MSDAQTELETPAILGWGGSPPRIRKKPHPWDPVIDEVRAKAPEWAEVDTREHVAANTVTQLRKRHPDMEFTQRGTSVWVRVRPEQDVDEPSSNDPLDRLSN